MSTLPSVQKLKVIHRIKLLYANLGGKRVLLSLVVFILCTKYIFDSSKEFSILLTVHWHTIAISALALLLNSFASAAQFTVLYQSLGVQIGIGEGLGLSQISSALNQLLPGSLGGMTRAVYMKHRYGAPYSQMPTVLLGSLIFTLFGGGLVMVFTNTIVICSGQTVPTIMWVVAFCAISSIFFGGISIPKQVTQRLGRFGNMLNLFSDGCKILRANKRCLIESSIYQLFAFFCWAAAIIVSYHGLGLSIHPLAGLSIAVSTAIFNIISITPGNLGIREAILGYLTLLSGFTFVQGVAASALLRAIGLAVNLVAAPISWYLLFFRQNIHLSSSE